VLTLAPIACPSSEKLSISCMEYMVGTCVDCPYSIRHYRHGDVRKLPLRFKTVLTVARAAKASSATTSIALVRLAAASSLSSVLLRQEWEKHLNSGATRSNPAFSRLLWIFIVGNAVPALAQWCGAIAIVVITFATEGSNIHRYRWVLLVRTPFSIPESCRRTV
jgi:hypothetical protein